jgi:hypothetical protein
MTEELIRRPQYTLGHAEKSDTLLRALNALTRHHREHSPEFRRLVSLANPGESEARTLAEVPHLPVGLFKSHRLASIPPEEVFKTLTSSGTTGQEVSRIVLDRETATNQTAALASIMTHVLGPQRLPMVIVDTRSLLKDRKQFSARGAGVLGMMNFGRQHFYALDDDMELDVEGLRGFLARFGGEPFLLFGFTFMVWQYFHRRLEPLGLDLSNGILVHSGGWKKLEEEKVGNDVFKERLRRASGLSRVYNFYGMVEQVGSVFMEGEDGFLYPPNFADVIIRDPVTWEEAAVGEPGVIQVLSVLPRSYPGHSLLTEDLGVVHGVDDSTCGRMGKRFSVLGRIPRAELRGCSDTHAFSRAA